MNRELLEQPFSPEQIKQRAGNFGRTLDYIEGHAVIQRLNDAFDGQWSFLIKSHEILEAEVVVLGELTADGFTKMQFGSSSITRAKNSGEIISLTDDLKSASTDCMKKCATMFGVGLHLYSGDPAPGKPVTKSARPVIENDPFAPAPERTIYCPSSPMNMQYSGGGNGGGVADSSNDNGTNGNGGNGTGRLSSKQYNYLVNLGVEHGLTKKDIDQKAIGEFGSAVAYLSKNDASAMIKQMLSN